MTGIEEVGYGGARGGGKTEAIAAMVALGPQLEWQPFTFGSGHVDLFADTDDGRRYIVEPGTLPIYEHGRIVRFRPSWAAKLALWDDSGHDHETEADAKAACEQHYATGHWE